MQILFQTHKKNQQYEEIEIFKACPETNAIKPTDQPKLLK